MSSEDSVNLFDSMAAPDAGGKAAGEKTGADETAVLHERDLLERMSNEQLIEYIADLQQHYWAMERDVSFLTWEFRDYQDNLTLFSRAAHLAHKLNASGFDTVVETATEDFRHFFTCDYAVLFLYNLETMRFELCRASDGETGDESLHGSDSFLAKLFTGSSYPFIARLGDDGVIELDNGKSISADIPPAWERLLRGTALVFPLHVKQVDSGEPLTLGGLVIAQSRRALEAKDAEASVIFADLLSSSLYNAQLVQKLGSLTIVDPLTQIFNRRHLFSQLTNAMNSAVRQGSPLSIAMIDIDDFKHFNDHCGHIVGDIVLREVASCLKSGIRAGVDIAARYGGDEFVLVMPYTTEDRAVMVAERIRKRICALGLAFEGKELSVTCSTGVAAAVPGESSERFISRADAALYRAKNGGRNRVAAGTASAIPLDQE